MPFRHGAVALCVVIMEKDSETDTVRRKRVYFRSWHRGTQEGDLLLGRFADRHLATMEDQALTEFEAVLEVPEPDLLAWYMRQADVPDDQKSRTLMLILDFNIYD
jgi:antitoxin CptB